MSRAFVKEDVDIAERSMRRKSPSGLPPGAANYLTADGAQRLRARVVELCEDAKTHATAIAELERVLESATIVELLPRSDMVTFGARVNLRDAGGAEKKCRIVGVDEVALEAGNVSWISPLGKALLGAEKSQRVRLPEPESSTWTVVEIA